jgi:DNA helicase-2/ATP-dependent DNA helicase PcrA
VAALRILDNPADELAWFRLLHLLEGVGPATARRIMTAIGVVPGPTAAGLDGAGLDRRRSHGDPVAALAGTSSGVPASAQAEAIDLCLALTDCRSEALAGLPGAQIDRLRDALEPLIRRRYDNCEVRLRDFEALAHLASGYQSRSRMTAQLILDPPVSTGDLAGSPHLDDDYLTLSTVHSAKGGEWRAVHLIHASDGSFPSDMATGSRREIEEERRLFYVALTRAKEHLYIYAPLRFHLGEPARRGDRHSYGQRSRFLSPAVEPMLEHLPVRTQPEDIVLAEINVQLDDRVTGSLHSLW